MKTLLKILAVAVFTLGFISCDPDDPSIVNPADILGTPFSSIIVYEQLALDWTSTGEQNVSMVATGGCQQGQFQQFDLESSHQMSIHGKVVRWYGGDFMLNGCEDNGISGVYEASGTIIDNKVTIEVDFFLTGGCGDYKNASGQIRGIFTNGSHPDVYELKLDGKIYQDLCIGR